MTGPRETPIRVLYIAGWGRSGSTLLHDILGQMAGCFAAGELQYIWDRSLRQNRLCGCSRPLRDCELWHEVFQRGFGGVEKIDQARLIELSQRLRTRHLLWLRLGHPESRLRRDLAPYLEALEKLYTAIHQVSGDRLIIDSSKSPAYAYQLSLIPGIELSVVHVVRDPRAVAHSWQRRKLEDGGKLMQRYGPTRSTLLWCLWNQGISSVLLPRSMRNILLRYEDLVSSPRDSLERVVRAFGLDSSQLPFSANDHHLHLHPNHATTGNPDRFDRGLVHLKQDREWETEMPGSARRVVTLLSRPFLARYGYSASGR